jgi:hypothetical protein
MTPEFRRKLDTLFDLYQKKIERAIHEEEEKAIKEQRFLMDFYKIKKELIRPVMDKIEDHIESLGYPVEIEETYDVISHGDKHIDASIVIQFMHIEDFSHPEYKNPFFSVTCDKRSQEVVLNQFTVSPVKGKSGRLGPEERFKLQELNQKMIEDKVYEVLQDIF